MGSRGWRASRNLHGIGMKRGISEMNVSKGRRHRHKKRTKLCWEAEASEGNASSLPTPLPLAVSHSLKRGINGKTHFGLDEHPTLVTPEINSPDISREISGEFYSNRERR